MTTATNTNSIASIAINSNAMDFWKETVATDIARYSQEGRIARLRAVLTVLNRAKQALKFDNADEVREVKRSLEVIMRWIGSPYIQYYFRNAWAATAKGLVKEVLNRKKGTQMEIHSVEEFDALIADLDSRIANKQNRKASETHRKTLVDARALFAPFEQPMAELDGALLITEAVESPEAARELLVDSPADEAKPEAKPKAETKQRTGVQPAPEGSEKPWRVVSEDGNFTEHTSRKAAREANKARTVNA